MASWSQAKIATIFGDGIGTTTPSVSIRGVIAPILAASRNSPGANLGPATASLKRVVGKAEIEIDSQPAKVLYAGTSPGSIESLTQINAKVSMATRSGSVRVRVFIDGIADAGNALIAIR